MIALKDTLGTKFVERIHTIFSENGPLSKAKNFEFRPQQQEMAARVAQALEEDRHLVVEAGTGVGKSLAYLAPAILFRARAAQKGDRFDAHDQSSGTTALQGHSDFEKSAAGRVRSGADERPAKLSLPATAGARVAKREGTFHRPREQTELKRLAEWASTTRDGSLSDLSVEPDPKVWTQVCSEAHICTQKTCGQNPRCFYQQARKRLLAADLIVMNHTLLFILLGSPDAQEERESGFLFPNDFIIFDEAHTVEQVASKQIGIGVSQYGLRSTIQRLYNARTRKGLVHRDARCKRRPTRGGD